MDYLTRLESDEAWRQEEFPVTRNKVFLAHAAVTTLPRVVGEAMKEYTDRSMTGDLEISRVFTDELDEARQSCADLIGAASKDEIALLGPTSLGLSLVAEGLPWQGGDEIVGYFDDYPANVYPWMSLKRQGVSVRFLEPETPGAITLDLVKAAVTSQTRMVALASANFLSGYRIDVDAIGAYLQERGILFCVDGIQSVGAFPTPVTHADFLSADAHKWMLGPMAAGMVYVRRELQDTLRPVLLGAWNVKSPQFIAQEKIEFEAGARRYEPGVLNAVGIVGMQASLNLLQSIGVPAISERLLSLKKILVSGLEEREFVVLSPREGASASAITTFSHPSRDLGALYRFFSENGVVASFRFDRGGKAYLRFSPHFYNTAAEFERVFELIDRWLAG